MMRILALLFSLCAPSFTFAQVIVGDAISASAIKHARDTLERATPKTLNLEPGEFEILEPSQVLKQPLLWLSSDEATLQRIDVAANQPLGLWMKRRGDASPKLHQFPAKPIAWVIVVGIKPGKATLTIIRNGENQMAPVVVDSLIITVGGTPPSPPAPVDDAFTQSLRLALKQDQQRGLFAPRWLVALTGIYATASRDALTNIKTAGDLDALLIQARQAAGIPEPDQMLPTVRQRLRQELLTQLNVTDADAGKPLSPEAKQLARQTLARIALALEVIHP